MTVNLPDDLADAGPCWRLLHDRHVTWHDMQTMTILDVDDFVRALDAFDDAATRAEAQAKESRR